jgi:hypothetical protein
MLLFEMPDDAAADDLAARLRSRWTEWVHDETGLLVVAVLLRPLPGDLAVLLREVEAWARERGLSELWFHLDRRSYLIRVPEAASAPTAA